MTMTEAGEKWAEDRIAELRKIAPEQDMVYFDSLHQVIESTTGLYLSI